jgi:NAD(P)-dependent dehydrogenase (short-subunit alcohol dehydrogenase family)
VRDHGDQRVRPDRQPGQGGRPDYPRDPDPDQRPEHRLDRYRGRDATQRQFHGAGDDWRAKAGASLPMGKLGQVDEIADFVVFLLSDRSGVVTGSVIDWDQNVLGGMD